MAPRRYAVSRSRQASPLRNVVAQDENDEPIIVDGEPLIIKGAPFGGNVISLLNLELRVPIWSNLRAVAFSDNGAVYPEFSDFTLGDWRYNVGFGFRYETPSIGRGLAVALFLSVTSGGAFAEPELVDRIVAIIDRDVIIFPKHNKRFGSSSSAATTA